MNLDDMSGEMLRLWVATQLLSGRIASGDTIPSEPRLEWALEYAHKLILANYNFKG